MDRVDTLIGELVSRHSNSHPKFLAAVRPVVVKILDDKTPEEARVPLLEMLAETFERDVESRASCEAARVACADWVDAIKRLLRG
ncbi:MAG: hypothetical protein ACI89X_000527 [Planctomycetota bacterium]|jgi:hypothetical protein